jgi:hypothetical protein
LKEHCVEGLVVEIKNEGYFGPSSRKGNREEKMGGSYCLPVIVIGEMALNSSIKIRQIQD